MDSSSLTIWHIETNAPGVAKSARTLLWFIPGTFAYSAPEVRFVERLRLSAFWRAICNDGIMSRLPVSCTYSVLRLGWRF